MGYALLAYTSWGLFPAFWRLLSAIEPTQILAQRVVWAALFFFLLLAAKKRTALIYLAIRDQSVLALVVAGSAMIGVNWYLYIVAVNSGRVLEASLGYFITPIVNVVLGVLFFKEKLTPARWAAFGLATLGVLRLAATTDGMPWISLSLALSFGTYGLIRKRLPIDTLVASTLEAFVLVPIAAGYWIYTGSPHATRFETVILVSCGAVTALPLFWFAQAARRLPLSSIAFFQYIAPSIQFILAVFVYGEKFTAAHAVTFGCIWIALTLYSMDVVRRSLGERSSVR